MHEKDSQAFASGYSDKSETIAVASLINMIKLNIKLTFSLLIPLVEGIVSIANKSQPDLIKHSNLGLCQSINCFKFLKIFFL